MITRVVIYDVETLINCFTYTDIDKDSDEVNKFVLHEDYNEFDIFIEYIMNKVGGMIGFNSISFDYPIIHYIIINREQFAKLPISEVISKIYQKAQDIIASQNEEFGKYKHQIPEWNMIIPQLDLFKIWHFDNKAKRTSLKKIQIAINWPSVQDMPIHHSQSIIAGEIEEVLGYNLNDVLTTKEFYLITKGLTDNKLYKGVDKIQLRKDIESEFNVKCINFNDVRIGDEINKINYLKATGIDKNQLKLMKTNRPTIYFKDCIPDFIKFKSNQLNEFLTRLKTKSISGTKGEFKEDIIYKGVKFSFRQGGIHTVDKGRKVVPKEDEILEDRDVASMYPGWIISQKLYPAHLGIEWLNGYIWTRDKRIEAKGLFKSTKEPKYQAIQEAYKLALNGGGYGKTGESFSWQFDPLVTMSTTIGNQLCLLMLCEEYLDNDITIISANTDGVLILFKKSQENLVKAIDKKWQETTNHVLEYIVYKLFAQSSVNDYLAVKYDGEVKYKGDFDPFRELHKNHSFRVIRLALSEYFVNNVPIEKTIKNHTNIYDFCGSENTNKDCYAETRYIKETPEGPILVKEKQQKTTRYYLSVNGNRFLRVYHSGKQEGGEEAINKGYKVTIFNNYVEKTFEEYAIDYQFYISEAYKIINVVENHNQLTLF